MPDIAEILERANEDGAFSEVYEVIHTVELVANRRTYRFEVCRNYSSSTQPYIVQYWYEDYVMLQPAAQTAGEFDEEARAERVLRREGLASAYGKTPEEALNMAINLFNLRR